MNAMTGSGGTGRPTFFEGQIVAAADLNGIVDNARIALAQHERYLHLPGIAEGLALTATERRTLSGQTYQDVTIGSGMAVDGTGRHLVLAASERLSEDSFDELNVAINDPLAYYPVFLRGRDETQASSGAPLVACFSNAPTRVTEVAELTFGRVEDADDPGNTPVDDVNAPPGGASGSNPWRVLLGFVQWDASIKRFSAVADSHDGIGRTYVGVRADEVVARGGVLTLRSASPGPDGKPAIAIDGTADGELRFGPQNSSGAVVPVFTVNAKGDVHATGKITGAIAGGAQIQTGTAYDGMLLPLPPGFTQAQVASGAVTVQAQVTPHYAAPALPTLAAGNYWLMTPLECRVVDLRVYCRVRWVSSNNVGGPFVLPGACDYTVMAFAPAD